MPTRTSHVMAALVVATGTALAAIAADSQKSGDGYVYAPTTLGSRTPQAYVAEPVASAAVGRSDHCDISELFVCMKSMKRRQAMPRHRFRNSGFQGSAL